MNYTDLANYFANAAVHYKQIYIEQMPQNMKENKETYYSFDSARLIVSLEGKLHLTVEGTSYIAEPGTIIHIAKGMQGKYENTEKIGGQIAHICFDAYKGEYSINKHFKVDIENGSIIASIAEKLKQCADQPASMAALKCQVLFYELLGKVVEGMSQCTQTAVNMEEVLDYMHQRYQMPLSVMQIAEYFHIDRRQLAYLFKRHTGMSPLNYLTEYRIRKSKELLRRREYPVMKVAELVGIEDNLYFSRMFKKRTGLSPTAYRESFSDQMTNKVAPS